MARIGLATLCYAGFFVCAFFLSLQPGLCAPQSDTPNRTISGSELAKDNLDRVAASESQIAAVLNGSPGLLVELKSWVAKDAADRGQLLKDGDLTDAAIYARLAQDQHFRAAATRLLQQYGYLLPK